MCVSIWVCVRERDKEKIQWRKEFLLWHSWTLWAWPPWYPKCLLIIPGKIASWFIPPTKFIECVLYARHSSKNLRSLSEQNRWSPYPYGPRVQWEKSTKKYVSHDDKDCRKPCSPVRLLHESSCRGVLGWPLIQLCLRDNRRGGIGAGGAGSFNQEGPLPTGCLEEMWRKQGSELWNI